MAEKFEGQFKCLERNTEMYTKILESLNNWNIDFVTALKKLIIISKENYLFQSALFIGTWNLWKCKFIPGIVLHFEMVPYMRQLQLQIVTSRLTKTMHHCPKKILTHVKFTVHIWTYLEKKICLNYNDVTVYFDPLHLKNHRFIDHSFQRNFD